MAYDCNNIFARILRGEIPSHKVYEDEHTLAFMDVMPLADGHTLVIPKTEATNLFEMPPEALTATILTTQRVVMRNWLLAYVGNVVGCLGTVLLIVWADIAGLGDGTVGETAVRIARVKADLSLAEAFTSGILCNALVCLAVWLAIGARSVIDKILAILFPITAFVTIGFEHSVENWFFLPFGLAVDAHGAISILGAGRNIVAVTAGNVAGGTLLVAGVYWVAYLRGERMRKDRSS